ncbi:MAG TPA: type II toxin-antitoxin system RelE/ParE family toxin [Blastocatellia bacterium]|nr:type II toxin-antitoxin system RelE/ParE family toxin [Blastocatellia bacterium]
MNTESQKLYTFIELPVFIRQLETLASFETLYAIQSDLLEDPERWPVIKGTGGARKGRVADPKDSRGKSGSFRYIYLYLEHRGRIFLLLLFSKNEQTNLSADQVKQVAAVVEKIKEANKQENP